MVAATTVVVYALIQYLDVRRGSVIYLLPVLLAGWHLGLIPALGAAVACVLWSGYFFFSPYYTFYLARPNEIVNLLLFMVVAVVTSHLANSMKGQKELAQRREKEVGDLYAFSRRLAASSSAADIYLAIEQHLASLVQRKVVLFGAASDRDAKAEHGALSQRVRDAIAEVQAGRTLATIVDDGAGDIWLVRRVSQKNADFGVIAIDLGSVPAGAIDEVRQRVNDVLSDAAATLERLDVARALNDAKMRSETELLREALIGSVSHELRTPLASILGAATVLSKSVLIEQAFGQIVDNAAKYSPPGSPITVAAKRNGHDVVLSVHDEGAGLTAQENARVGERFFRGPRHATTTSGSGLGLWIAKAFVSANGGKIEAASAGADRGAPVSIHL